MVKIYTKNLTNKYPTKDITDDDLRYKLKLINSKIKRKININSKITINEKNLPIIAGPNGIENKKLLIKTAKLLKKNKLNFIRAHAFKPLTFPYRSKQYDEVGLKGLDWVDEIKKDFKLIFVAEITEIRFLNRMLKSIDILQIGSRNMQNLELLREVAKTKKPIILKRHFGASIRDFLGAAEHILVEGNDNLILCERGISAPHTHRSTSRFILDLQAICALKEITNFPVFSDPSHATFWNKWVSPMGYSSVAAGCDGLIIETHPNPKKSMVDPLQPLNFKEFSSFVKKVKKLASFFGKKII